MQYRTRLLLAAATLVAASSASAATLAQYVPTGAAANSTLNATTVDSQLTASAIGNINTAPNGNQLGSGSSGPVRTLAGSWTISTDGGWLFSACNNDGAATGQSSTADYFNFTVNTNNAVANDIQLNSLKFDYGVGANTALGLTTFSYAVFASVNGGSFTQLGSLVSNDVTIAANTTNNLGQQTIDLTSISGAGVDSVELRVWVGSSTTNGGAGSLFRTITLDGTVTAVPEPSTYGLIGAGALAAVAMVRRRRKVAGHVA